MFVSKNLFTFNYLFFNFYFYMNKKTKKYFNLKKLKMKDYNAVTKVNKFQKSQNKSNQKLSTYGGRNEIIDPDLYYQTRDENIELKKK